MSWLWILIPDEAIPVIVIIVGLLLILGLVRPRAAFGILGLLLLLPLLSPLIEALFEALPPWISFLVLAWVGLAILRGLATLFLGRGASDEMVGTLAAHLVIAVLLLPVRILRWAFRLVTNNNG
jgi:hypothetical protein